MLIWKGRGILIPVFALIGFVAGTVVTSRLYEDDLAGVMLSMWTAAAGVWVFALTLGKSSSQRVIDTTTGRHHLITRSHTFFFLPGSAWAIVATLVAVFASVGGLTLDDERSSSSSFQLNVPPGGQQAFDSANSKITSSTAGIAHGNSPEAKLLAQAFSSTVKSLRDMSIERGKSTVSLSGGDFLTYAHLTPTRCVFLVHVPQLRKFSKDAKETMAEIAWITAQQVASEISPRPHTLTVGIRGALIYDRALTGEVVNEPEENRDGVSQEVTGTAATKLLAFQFAPESPAPVAVPTATPQSDAETLSGDNSKPTETSSEQ